MKRAVFFIILLTVALATCKKDLEDFDSNWTGEWHSDAIITDSNGDTVELYMIINGSHSEYGWLCEPGCYCNCAKYTKGKAVINKKHNKIYIGKGWGENEKLTINVRTHPYKDATGTWFAVIDGGTLDVRMKKR